MNKRDKLNLIIGSIVSGFVTTEFLISNIVYELGLKIESKMLFFAENGIESKINNLIKQFEKSDILSKEVYIVLLQKFNDLRIHRNRMVHSIILNNDEDYRTYNYTLSRKKEIIRDIGIYTESDFYDLKNEIIKIHNNFHDLYYSGKIN